MKSLACSEVSIKTITPEDVWATIRGDRQGAYLLVDVRTKEEYEEEHLPGARLIPLHELDTRHGELDREKKIITYCRSGKRSMGGALLLCHLGFYQLYSMEGGISAWPYHKLKGPPEEGEELFRETKEIKDLLLIALQMERVSYRFYHQLSQKVDHPALKDPLRSLSLREATHRDTLYRQLQEVWPGAPPLAELKESTLMEGAVSLPQVFAQSEEKVPKEKIDILELALEKECKAFDLYQRMSIRVQSPLKEVLRELAQQERSHIDQLSQLI